MKNLTLAIEDVVLGKARLAAAKQRTTVNAAVRQFLMEFGSQEDRIAKSKERLRQLMDEQTGRLGADFKWDRDALHDD